MSSRLDEHKLCPLVVLCVRGGGLKVLIALADGYREPAESWADRCAPARRGPGRRRRRAGVHNGRPAILDR